MNRKVIENHRSVLVIHQNNGFNSNLHDDLDSQCDKRTMKEI